MYIFFPAMLKMPAHVPSHVQIHKPVKHIHLTNQTQYTSVQAECGAQGRN